MFICGGSGGKPGGGGGGMDMTTPVNEIGLEKTISQISTIGQAMVKNQQQARAENERITSLIDAGKKADYTEKRRLRDEYATLEKRHSELKNSITRSMTGPKGNYRETLIKGKELIDLGPYNKGFSSNYGPVGAKAKKFTNRSDLYK